MVVAPGVLRLQLRTDGHALVPAFAPEILKDAEIRAEFGIEDPLVVLITSADPAGVFNTRTLRLVCDLTNEFKRIAALPRHHEDRRRLLAAYVTTLSLGCFERDE